MMARPQVTITLGRSGQKVVKRPWDYSDDSGSVAPPTLSGSKRYGAENNAQGSLSNTNKRLRVDIIARSSGYSGPGDASVSGNDLRLKLLRKRMSRQIELEIEERKKKELRDKMLRTVQSSEEPQRSVSRNFRPIRGAGESLQVESFRSSYSSYNMDGLRPKSPNRGPQISGGMSSSRPISEVRQLPPAMPIFASRTGRVVCTDRLNPSRPKGPTPMTVMTASTRTSLDTCKSLQEFPPASSSMMRNTYQDEYLTVSNLLHSLGLGKYAILFQVEEVDIAALKQMGDCDLKELGIPMGPRKKILLAMLARSKRPTA